MPDAPRARVLLHALTAALLSFLLLGAAERLLPLLLHPFTAPLRTALLLLALATPALPLRPRLRAGAGAALAGAVAALASLSATVVAGAVTIAAGSLWLALAPRRYPRRALAGGVALGVALRPLEPLLAEVAGAASALAGAAGVLALATLAAPAAVAQEGPERRARGLRLRGALALGALLYLDWALRQQYPAALAPGTVASAGAALLVLLLPPPVPSDRRGLLSAAALAAALLLLTRGSMPALGVGAARVVLVLFIGRALVPAAARRPPLLLSLVWLVAVLAGGLAAALGGTVSAVLAALFALAALALLPR